MSSSQTGGANDWSRIKRARGSMSASAGTNNVPQSDKTEDLQVEPSKGGCSLPKGGVLPVKIPRDYSPKGTKRVVKNGSRAEGSFAEERDEDALAAFHQRKEEDFQRMLQHFRNQFEKTNCHPTESCSDSSECRLVEDASAQLYIRNRAIRISYDCLLAKNQEKNRRISKLEGKVTELEGELQETRDKCSKVEDDRSKLEESFSRADGLIKRRSREIASKDQELTRMSAELADWKEKFELAKYAGGLWAKDQILLRFPEAKPFVAWMEPPDDEPQVNIVDDNDGAS